MEFLSTQIFPSATNYIKQLQGDTRIVCDIGLNKEHFNRYNVKLTLQHPHITKLMEWLNFDTGFMSSLSRTDEVCLSFRDSNNQQTAIIMNENRPLQSASFI